MNNLLSYCGLVDPRISTSDKDLPVKTELCQLFLFRSRMELKAMEEASFRVDTAVEAVERGSCNSC